MIKVLMTSGEEDVWPSADDVIEGDNGSLAVVCEPWEDMPDDVKTIVVQREVPVPARPVPPNRLQVPKYDTKQTVWAVICLYGSGMWMRVTFL